MDVLVATIGFPACFLLLAAGWGLLVDRAAARSLHGALVAPVGYGAIVVVSQLLTRKDGLSDTTPFVLLLGGLAGLVVGWPRLRRIREGVEPALAFLIAYGISIAPVLLSGRPTITAYLKDTTPGTHLAGAYGLIEHGASFAGGPATSDGNQLRSYFDNAYPSGGHTALAGVGRLFGTDLLWLFQPFMALCLALIAPSLWLLARRLRMGRVLAISAAAVASVPAITYAYALQGSIKEIAYIPMLALLPALLADAPRWLPAGWRGPLPLAVAGAAGIGALGIAGSPWILLAFGIAALLILQARREAGARVGDAVRAAVVPVAALAAAFLVLIFPVLANFASSFNVANNFSQSNAAAAADPGNLFGPLKGVQALGVWIVGDQRVLPGVHLTATYELIGVVLLLCVIGGLWLTRRVGWTTLAWLLGTLAIWWVLDRKGTIWTDAKLLVLVAPTLVFVAFVGASSLGRASRLITLVGAAAIALGVLWSDAVLYHETNLMPTARYDEASALNERYAGQGPAWTPDFDEYLFTALRDVHVTGPGFAYTPQDLRTTVDGTFVGYGQPEDLDSVPLQGIERFPLIIERDGPERSRPPSNYRLVHDGLWQVWQRRGPAPVAHLGALGEADPTGVPSCADVRRLGRTAREAGVDLIVARRPATVVRNLGDGVSSANWPRSADGVTIAGPGFLTTAVRVPRAGEYKLWLRGDVARPVTFAVDGRVVGARGYESGGAGNYIPSVSVRLTAGRHEIRLSRGGGTLHPGDGQPTNLRRLVIEPAARSETIERVPASEARSLCGERVDWIEAAPR